MFVNEPQRPLRVAHLVENLELGGLEKLLVEFARHTDRARFRIRFATLGVRGHLAPSVEALGWPVHAFNFSPGLRPRAAPALAAWLRRAGIDVLHSHSSGPLLYGTLAAKLAGVPRVVTTRHHGPDINNSPRAVRACAVVANLNDRIVCVSRDGYDHARSEGVKRARLTIIPNGIDLERFPCLGPRASAPALAVGRLTPEKGHDLLIRAIPAVLAEAPDFRLHLAGDGPLRDDLEALARALGVTDAVQFLGRVDDVPALLASASMALLPSRKEGAPLALLEALASALPVVATRVGGMPEVIDDGITGLLVAPESPEALAAAILRLHGAPGFAADLGRAGRLHVEAHYDLMATIAAYENLYRNDPPRGAATLEPVHALCAGGRP